ncbi:MAG: LacI family transcriptional regulator [bacterium]|nr:LacI family transcriptional regulator [bacterium]
MRRTTIKDIAKKLQLSPATISLALNSSPLVNTKTMQRVKRAAEEMGYRPNAVARSLVLKKRHILGIIIPDITNAFFSAIVSGAEKAANAGGYNLLICDTNWSNELESRHLNLIFEESIDGIIMAYWNKENQILEHLLERNYPLVFVSSAHPHQHAHFVGADTEQGGYLAAKHLLELGHRDIAFIGGALKSESIQRRYAGFLKAFEEHQFSFQADLMYEGEFSVESGYKNGVRLLQEVPHITGILAADDLIAIGVLKAAAELGRQVPEELSLVGFDDIAAAAFPGINLTTVFQEKYLMGHLAVEMLLEQLEPKKNVAKKKRVVLPIALKIRKTTGPCRRA